MKTLHEMAAKCQESIIKQQNDAHNSATLNVTKYNNLKLKMSTRYPFPHVIVIIGISEAVFNIAEGTKTDGGLGPDEKYIKKWLGTSTVVADLKEIYLALGELVKAEDGSKAISQEGEADEVKKEAVSMRKKKAFKDLLDNVMPLGEMPIDDDPGEEMISIDESVQERIHPQPRREDTGIETVDDIKKDLKSFLKSMFRRK